MSRRKAKALAACIAEREALREEVGRLSAALGSARRRIERDAERYREILDALNDHGLDSRGVRVLKSQHDEMVKALTRAAVRDTGWMERIDMGTRP